jgi:hypothetical protein
VDIARAEAPAPDVETAVAPEVAPALESYITGVTGGSALPDGVRRKIEPHLGADLSGVMVHADTAAAKAAFQLNARAFTYGKDIFLAEGESAGDLELMAHEATHVVQQGAVEVYRVGARVQRAEGEDEDDDWFEIPDWVLDGVRDAAAELPGYTLLTELMGQDPITEEAVSPASETLVEHVLTFLPGIFGAGAAPLLGTIDVLGDVVTVISDGLDEHNLTLARLVGDIGKAWDEFSVTNGIDGNVEIVARYVAALVDDVKAFIRSIIDAVVEAVRAVVAEVAEPLLETEEIKPVWELATKVLHLNPLTGEDVEASTVEILGDFLRLIDQEPVLAQMEERGTLQLTADWLDTQFATFANLTAELGQLFADAWAAISPQNLPDLLDNLAALAERAFGFVRRVGDFAQTVIGKVLELVKTSLLGWLSEYAHDIPGFQLLTVILERNPFTGEVVERTAENLIRGFITLLPGGEGMYEQLAESGVIAAAAGRIESEMGRLGISWDLVTNLFRGIWDLVTLESLLSPVQTFRQILDLFGEPLGRLAEFVGVVMQTVITLILELMNFPSDLLASIIDKTVQAIDDIMTDPVGFLVNMLEAVRGGFMSFLDKIAGYLVEGLTDWLFRGLGALGIQAPPDLSLASVLDLVLGVLGLTAETLWRKLAAQVGEGTVDRIRQGIDQLTGAWAFLKDATERGLSAIWEYVSDKVGDLWGTIVSAAKDWVLSEIIDKVVGKLVSMLDPTGVMAVVNSFIAFFSAIQSAIEYLREILEIVNDFVSTVAAVAAGNIEPGAAKLEQGLASAVPVAIGFLANQVGLSNVPEKVVEIIHSLRQMIDEALDWLLAQAMRLGQAALSTLGVGMQSTGSEDDDHIDEAFAIGGERHHLFVNSANRLMVASDEKPVSDLEQLHDLYSQYIGLAPSPMAPRKSVIEAMIELIKKDPALIAALGTTEQLYDPPNLGEVTRHGSQTQRFQPPSGKGPSYAPLWELESEHVIPKEFLGSFFKASRTVLAAAGGAGLPAITEPEYDDLTTVLIYLVAADIKTDRIGGDLQTIRELGAEWGRTIVTLRDDRAATGDAIMDYEDDAARILQRLAVIFNGVLGRAQSAVDEEWRSRAPLRGWPTSGEGKSQADARLAWLKGKVAEAHQLQLPQMVALLDERISPPAGN